MRHLVRNVLGPMFVGAAEVGRGDCPREDVQAHTKACSVNCQYLLEAQKWCWKEHIMYDSLLAWSSFLKKANGRLPPGPPWVVGARDPLSPYVP